MLFNRSQIEGLDVNGTKFPEGYSGTPTWLPFLSLGSPTRPPSRHVKTTNKDDVDGEKKVKKLHISQ